MTPSDKRHSLYLIDLILDFYLPSIASHMDGGGDHDRMTWMKIREIVKGVKEEAEA
jgi:hypothetical protein